MISFPWIIPTVDEPMSAYTAMAFSFLAVAASIVSIIAYNWLRREFKAIHRNINDHDEFVVRTADDIATVRTDIAVLLEKCGGTKEDVESIKHSINDVQHTLLQMSKK